MRIDGKALERSRFEVEIVNKVSWRLASCAINSAGRETIEIMKKIKVIGGGLAGPEAALQAASLGCEVTLYEMRPTRSTEAHLTSDFAELVCSNSLKSESENSAPWLLKKRCARQLLPPCRRPMLLPSPQAMPSPSIASSSPVASLNLSTSIRALRLSAKRSPPSTKTPMRSHPRLGPPHLARAHLRASAADRSTQLAFYDSIAPIVDASTIDMDKVYFAARWDKGTADYINCPSPRRSMTSSSTP